MSNKFPFYRQLDTNDCGASALRMIAKYYGKEFSNDYLRDKCSTNKGGANLIDLCRAAESIGFHTHYLKLSFEQLKDSPLPLIVHWEQKQFIVVYKIKKKFMLLTLQLG